MLVKKRPVIITCPHCCDASVDPSCDALSKEASSAIVNATGAKAFYNENVLRRDVDMNRPEARNTPWRLAINEAIIKMKNPIVIDVHTYSKKDLDEQTMDWAKHDAVFLLHPFNHDEISLVKNVLQSGNEIGVDISVTAGQQCCLSRDESLGCSRPSPGNARCNDIVSMAEYLGASAILIEVNQDSMRDPGFPGKLEMLFQQLRDG